MALLAVVYRWSDVTPSSMRMTVEWATPIDIGCSGVESAKRSQSLSMALTSSGRNCIAPTDAITINDSSLACLFRARLYSVCTACSARSSAMAPDVSSSAVVNLGGRPASIG